MYIYLKNEVKCGECGSRDIAKTIENYGIPGRFVCLSCGHREPRIEPIKSDFGNVYVYEEKETVF